MQIVNLGSYGIYWYKLQLHAEGHILHCEDYGLSWLILKQDVAVEYIKSINELLLEPRKPTVIHL